ncbi:MAG: DNA repair nucleotidyltransferase [Planctomycetes bacterium]|nr:DNA repair nucleotidyltransferase [Planctomycetota bacterium]
MACVDLPALPLQMLLRQHPDWRGLPAAVVDRDKPQGELLWVNEHARALRILPGMRYAAGLGVCRALRAGTVPEEDIQSQVAALVRQLSQASPRVEASQEEPGVFWLDADGFEFLYPSLRQWGEGLRRQLRRLGFEAVIAIGFTRFGSYAAARAGRGVQAFESPQQEEAQLRQVPLDRLGLAPRVRDRLAKLGLHTLGAFATLPEGGVRRRFGVEAQKLHQAVRGLEWAPLCPEQLTEPLVRRQLFELPEVDAERLLFLLQSFLSELLPTLAQRHEGIARLQWVLQLEDGSAHEEELSPAQPTRDEAELLSLLRLRFEAIRIESGVVELQLRVHGVAEQAEQSTLFAEAPKRNPEAARRAFAQLRAEFGNEVVQHTRLHEGHLPEAQFAWEVCEELPVARASEVRPIPLIRRIYTPPQALPPRPRHEPDGWLIAGHREGPVEEVHGPFLLSGGWWLRETARTYSYVRTRSGRWLWVYHDRFRRRWMLHGELE